MCLDHTGRMLIPGLIRLLELILTIRSLIDTDPQHGTIQTKKIHFFLTPPPTALSLLSSGLRVTQQQRWSGQARLWSAQRSCLGVCQQSYYSTQEAEKEPEEEPLHTIISDTESVQGAGATGVQTIVCHHLLYLWLSKILFHPWFFQAASPNMSFRLKQKSCWTLLPGPCTRRKRWESVYWRTT